MIRAESYITLIEMNTDKTIMTFVRGRNGQPRGVIVAGFDEDAGVVRMGWSYTNLSAGDRFNKVRALQIAKDRIHTNTDKRVPRDVRKRADEFVFNCMRYFRTDEITIAGTH